MMKAYRAFKTIQRERKKQKSMAKQSNARNALARMQRGRAVSYGSGKQAIKFVAEGMPKPKYK